MTDNIPRQISYQEIQAGDRIIVERRHNGAMFTVTGVAQHQRPADPELLPGVSEWRNAGRVRLVSNWDTSKITLLARPQDN